jgi:mono/diheme cytochrome c family protein
MAKLPDIDLDLKLPKPPFWLIAGFIILVIVTWIPLALIARARVSKSSEPRVHLFLDMDQQVKKGAQSTSPVFEDRRAMRGRITGTVARGELRADDHFYRGYRVVQGESGQASTEFIDGLPEQITVDRAFVERGRAVYNNFCYPCHGKDGYGQGPVHVRTQSIVENTNTLWVPPRNLHLSSLKQRSDGYLYFVIGNGVANMSGYASQIEPRDRWAIVAYMRALQLAEQFPESALTAEQKAAMGAKPSPQAEDSNESNNGE